MVKKQTGGFTIIEVVLVLAVAGLIFLVVFIALPQLQASRRDSERQTAIQSLFAELQKLPSYPATESQHDDFVANINAELLVVSSGTLRYDIPYRAMTSSDHADAPSPEQIFYQVGHQCSDGATPVEDTDEGHARHAVAVWVGLERGGHKCLDNS